MRGRQAPRPSRSNGASTIRIWLTGRIRTRSASASPTAAALPGVRDSTSRAVSSAASANAAAYSASLARPMEQEHVARIGEEERREREARRRRRPFVRRATSTAPRARRAGASATSAATGPAARSASETTPVTGARDEQRLREHDLVGAELERRAQVRAEIAARPPAETRATRPRTRRARSRGARRRRPAARRRPGADARRGERFGTDPG